MCVICFNEDKPTNYTTSCSHSFHVGCLMKWWHMQNATQGCISCPLCRYEPTDDEIEHSRLYGGAIAWIMMMSRGEDKFKDWIESLKGVVCITPMEDVLDAPEYIPTHG